MSKPTSTEIRLASRPTGWPTPENFETATVQLPDLAEGEVRVSNEYLSVDPYMRGRMNDAKSYAAPYALGEVMTGAAVGEVVESRAKGIALGDKVLHHLGWRSVSQGPAAAFRVVQEISGVPLSAYMGILGMTAYTAYVGLLEIARLKEGDIVFISGAAGAVGSAAGQIARLKGAARVIGSAGTDKKVALLKDKYGFDAAFNYKDAPVLEQLRAAAPEGIDVYFDNVGGDHLEAALSVFNRDGRAALCGSISSYNATEAPAGPRNMGNLITQGLSLKGYTVGFHPGLFPDFVKDMSAWLDSGEVVFEETVIEGLENAVHGFLELMRGANTGKMVIKL
ncbi:NADP-dependent oxidoreductase [Paeniglutamicibacter psychrophenolicus]|uniref:NADPH-dependent curcumin reductase CurA n=1 Tax=Paeniglutamicibacter psychrophenolicus TaxID=257454 RepID=A0ABS4WAX1_9MICC|nr:NADP-dependent oxidoreductase [Paeniglutamicibacter psychrophenolicus]MBP2373356.1 NADPH-dependent curcumin reductase CurA [Paeniglutamicibacter psychrophenolicus]